MECGIDGVIIPDLPFHDYQERYRIITERYGIKVIMLITPETSEERVRELMHIQTDSFILVSRQPLPELNRISMNKNGYTSRRLKICI